MSCKTCLIGQAWTSSSWFTIHMSWSCGDEKDDLSDNCRVQLTGCGEHFGG